MRAVVADTSPLNYLVLIDHVSILPALFGTVSAPALVRDELLRPFRCRPDLLDAILAKHKARP